MKKLFHLFTHTSSPLLAGILLSFLLVVSCKLPERNINPTATTDAPVAAILTGAEASLGFSLGADLNPITAIFVQQFSGSNGDASAYENYVESSGRYDQLWGDVFPGAINNFQIIKTKALATNSPYYAGIARILLSFSYGSLTDVFGDIPYSQALQGRGNTAPPYDSQEAIYAGIQSELSTAIEELSQAPSSFSTPAPGTDDILFQGNTAKWIAAAWTLKARYALHLSKIDPNAASQALEYSKKGIQSNAGDLQVNFGSSSTNSNPYSQFQSFRKGWVSLSASFVNLLNGNQPADGVLAAANDTLDPRRAYFATPAAPNVYQGFRLGVKSSPASIGPYFASASSPVIFTSYAENKFIEAEALVRLNAADPAAQASLTAAVNASFNKVITNPADTNATTAKREAYLKLAATLTADQESNLQKILTQKYIALFTQSEVWVDYRRTGYPKLPLVSGGSHSTNPNGQIPRRTLYPSNEQLLNPNAVNKVADHQTPRLWWDK